MCINIVLNCRGWNSSVIIIRTNTLLILSSCSNIAKSTAPAEIVNAFAAKVASPDTATLSNESDPSWTRMCPPLAEEMSVSVATSVDVVDTKERVPEPFVERTCPFGPSR